MKKLLIIGLLLCLMSGCQKNTGTFAQGDKNLSSVFADINEQIADGAFSIALFQVKKEHEGDVKKAIKSRKEALEKQWGAYVPEAADLLYQAKEGRIGQYYYFVLGSDSEKVVNYMQKMDA